jgi:methylase of polypeptide subunit release factors
VSSSLDARERDRQAAQQALDGRRSAALRNRTGQFATPTALALEMALLGKQLLPARGGIRLLDPAVGSGVFFYAARKELPASRLHSALGFETDAAVATKAEHLWGNFGLRIRIEDFCTATAPAQEDERATLVLCNPPYVRHHHLSAAHKSAMRRELAGAGFRLSGLAGLYCYFLLLAHRWLAPGGVGMWIVPAEFLDVNYGRALKEYLTGHVTLHRAHRFDPEDGQFADALVSSVVLAFVNAPPPAEHRVQLNSGRRLLEPQIIHEVPLADLDPAAKWGPLFTSTARGRSGGNGRLTVGDLFFVKRGLATGANEYFILERRRAHELGLPEQFLRPILSGPRHVPGPCIERGLDGGPCELPDLVLLDCDLPLEQIRQEHPALMRYLQRGERQGIPRRYLPSHRPLWYRQEKRPPAPILCTYMGRHNGGRAIRFIRNRSEVTAPNVYLLLYPRPRLSVACRKDPDILDRLFAALGEIAEGLSYGGRVYGGGLYKIEPKELTAMEFPAWVHEQYGDLRVEEVRPLDLFVVGEPKGQCKDF